ncbi:F-box/LRR-repeat protein 13 [Melia azedarach]|uniref:F-box/LRR-repeat protein 13 n=1 Tax=Melia azedarach TaxID=155640 RepID=A0ACC1XBF7_MELAZ|nr:F-box/LRR-repeat protein 13 [Melia azedarach]
MATQMTQVSIEPATPAPTRNDKRRSVGLVSKSSVLSDDDDNYLNRKRKLDVGEILLGLKGGESEGVLNLRSGRKVLKRIVENDGNKSVIGREEGRKGKGVELEFEVQSDKKEKGILREVSEEGVTALDTMKLESNKNGDETCSEKRGGRFGREEKGKAKLFDEDSMANGTGGVECEVVEEGVAIFDTMKLESNQNGDESCGEKRQKRFGREEKKKAKLIDEDSMANGTGGVEYEEAVAVFDMMKLESKQNGDECHGKKRQRRFGREEKGKAKLIDDDSIANVRKVIETGEESEVKSSVLDSKHLEDIVRKTRVRASESRMEQFRDIARQNASKYAYFSSQDPEENHSSMENEKLVPDGETEREIEDWPGPFSTAMKIIRDRATKLNGRQETSTLGHKKSTLIPWIPRKGLDSVRTKLIIPSLEELCLKILLQNADAITSLENVPDALRHRLSHMLCDSRRMNSHFLNLLVSGSPTEIRIRDCSWLTEQEFTKAFETCDTSSLTVLQLDRCGRCMPDYILLSTLARSSNSLPSLTTLSLCGACRLSDVGFQALVSSASSLRSINLTQCSLLTPTSIDILANSLGSFIQELYINDCQNLNAMLILPALKKLKHLEVLSIAGIDTVNDDFVGEIVSARGHNMKELVLTDCVKLTDFSMKVIAESCPKLCTLDISNLYKLTDFSIGYLADGCRAIETLKLCRNAFSDEAIAAFLESCGESLKELSLNNIKKHCLIACQTIKKLGEFGFILVPEFDR